MAAGDSQVPEGEEREAILRRIFGDDYSSPSPKPKTIETESDWLAATADDLSPVVMFLQPRVTRRKPLLLAVAGCRRISHLLGDGRLQELVEATERFADGLSSEDDVEQVAVSVGEQESGSWNGAAYTAVMQLSELSRHPMGPANGVLKYAPMASCRQDVPITDTESRTIIVAEKGQLFALLCDIFGNPFRPVTFDPGWQSETVIALAAGIYAERAFDRMPILADALEDAGCDHADILAHCRGEGPHVRGCWVVDLILGKS